MSIIYNNKKYLEITLKSEDEFEKIIFKNYKLFFGEKSLIIDAKKKIATRILGETIPDGFLFDFSDKDNPEFYLIEVELASHDFFKHIFPQITKFFAFFKNNKSQKELTEKIYSIINTDDNLKKELKKYLGEKEVYKFLNDVIENSQNILLILDGDKNELPEIIETYTDTWGKLVKVLKINIFKNNSEQIYSITPDFENIEFTEIQNININEQIENKISENYHLEDVNENVLQIYNKIKESLLKINPDLIFNPQKYYISIIHSKNIAFFKIRKKKVRLIIMSKINIIKDKIHKNQIKDLSESVQNFYNGECAAIDIDNIKNVDEVIDLLKEIIKKNSEKIENDNERKLF